MDMVTWEADVPADLRDPVLVVCMEGWIDAGFAAATAMGQLKLQVRTNRLLRFDTDELVDWRARRPVMRLVDGVNTGLSWPRIQIRHGKDAAGAHLLVLTGPEPDMRWRGFLTSLMDIVDQLGVRQVIAFGAFPSPAPHSRPVTIGSTATTRELADLVGYLPGSFEIPSGITAAIERACADADVPAAGIWARVPHYVAQMPYPAASAALLETFARITGMVVDTTELRSAGERTSRQVDELVANNPEHVAMLRQLEANYDETEATRRSGSGAVPIDLGPLPTGDELAAELEKFLRDQNG
jgi:predicted ATP-grasp superfamily ATP-dependent carboligase